MRKQLFKFYNFLASYPVLFFLILGICVLVYFGEQYKPLKLAQVRKMETLMQLKQKRQTMEKESADIEMVDLAKRYTLFNQDFLDISEIEEGILFNQIASTFKAYGWNLDNMEETYVDDAFDRENLVTENKGARIDGLIVHLEARSVINAKLDGEPFLPLYAASEAMKFMWSKPPIKEYLSIKIFRQEEGYGLEASIFIPLQDIENSSELEKAETI